MNAIVVVDKNWAIGRDNRLLFSIPADMRRFRELTLGAVVIMGRKTLDSFPGGRPLPGRRNVVITRNPDFHRAGAEAVSSPDAARMLLAGVPPEQLWVIGGDSVYAALLRWCVRVLVTKVDAAAQNPDAYFPNLDKLPEWRVAHSSAVFSQNAHRFRFVEYRNYQALCPRTLTRGTSPP